MKKITDTIFTIVMLVAVTLAILLVGVRIFGLTPYTVLSGSMEPTYHVGSLIYVKSVAVDELKVGDPITYHMESGVVVTHRIVGIITDDDDPTVVRFQTKGDANNEADGTPIDSKNVIGKPMFSIPLLGYVSYYIQNPPGSYIALCAMALLLFLSFLPDIIGSIFKENRVEEERKKLNDTRKDTEALMQELRAMRDDLERIRDSEERSGSAETNDGEGNASPSDNNDTNG